MVGHLERRLLLGFPGEAIICAKCMLSIVKEEGHIYTEWN